MDLETKSALSNLLFAAASQTQMQPAYGQMLGAGTDSAAAAAASAAAAAGGAGPGAGAGLGHSEASSSLMSLVLAAPMVPAAVRPRREKRRQQELLPAYLLDPLMMGSVNETAGVHVTNEYIMAHSKVARDARLRAAAVPTDSNEAAAAAAAAAEAEAATAEAGARKESKKKARSAA